MLDRTQGPAREYKQAEPTNRQHSCAACLDTGCYLIRRFARQSWNEYGRLIVDPTSEYMTLAPCAHCQTRSDDYLV